MGEGPQSPHLTRSAMATEQSPPNDPSPQAPTGAHPEAERGSEPVEPSLLCSSHPNWLTHTQ